MCKMCQSLFHQGPQKGMEPNSDTQVGAPPSVQKTSDQHAKGSPSPEKSQTAEQPTKQADADAAEKERLKSLRARERAARQREDRVEAKEKEQGDINQRMGTLHARCIMLEQGNKELKSALNIQNNTPTNVHHGAQPQMGNHGTNTPQIPGQHVYNDHAIADMVQREVEHQMLRQEMTQMKTELTILKMYIPAQAWGWQFPSMYSAMQPPSMHPTMQPPSMHPMIQPPSMHPVMQPPSMHPMMQLPSMHPMMQQPHLRPPMHLPQGPPPGGYGQPSVPHPVTGQHIMPRHPMAPWRGPNPGQHAMPGHVRMNENHTLNNQRPGHVRTQEPPKYPVRAPIQRPENDKNTANPSPDQPSTGNPGETNQPRVPLSPGTVHIPTSTTSTTTVPPVSPSTTAPDTQLTEGFTQPAYVHIPEEAHVSAHNECNPADTSDPPMPKNDNSKSFLGESQDVKKPPDHSF